MDTIFIAFAIITPICLAVWFYKRMGCIAAIVVFVATVWGFSYAEKYVDAAIKWRDKRLEEKAKEAEVQKAQQAEAVRAKEARRQQEATIAKIQQKRQEKTDKIRTFALKDAPKVWAVYQSLKSEVDIQNGKIEELRKSLVAFGRSPEQDVDFKRICALRDEMIRSQKALYAKLEDAYIAACKFAATPGRKEYRDVQRKALEDGIREAEAAEAKFKEMRLSK